MSTPPDPYNAPGDESRNELPSSEPGETDRRPSLPGPPEAPPSIVNAVRLMFAGAGLLAIFIITLLASVGEIRDQLAEGENGLTGEQLDAGIAFFAGFFIVTGLIGVGLWIWMAQANKRGLSWARVLATVLGVLNILASLFFLIGSSGLSLVVLLLMIALSVVIIWMLFRPESSQYYNAVSEYRQHQSR